MRKVSKIKIKFKAVKNRMKILKDIFKHKGWMNDTTNYISKKIKRKYIKIKSSNNKIYSLLSLLLSSRITIILTVLILSLKANLFYTNIEAEIEFTASTRTMAIICLSIFVFPLFFIKKDKNRFRWCLTYNIFFSTLLFADNIYWDYSSNLISVSQIGYIQYGEEIISVLPYFLKLNYILYFIDIPIILAIWNILKLQFREKKTKIIRNKGKRKIIFAFIYTAFILICLVPIIKSNFNEMMDKKYKKLTQIEIGSIYGYHLLDLLNSIDIKETTTYKTYEDMMADYEKIKTYNLQNYEIEENIYGIAKDKNVIVIQLESLQNFVVNRSINGKEITPNLNKFLKENIEITNMLQQSYSSTSDAEYGAMTSLYPLDNGQVFTAYYTSINNDIYKILKENGYTTCYLHGNVPDFWNRKGVYSRLNIDKISFIQDFDDTSEIIQNYLSDELFYKQIVSKLEEYKEPFYAFAVAASSHTAFGLEGIENKDSKVSIDTGKYKDTYFGAYIESVNYADYAFGIFIQELKEKGLYEDSVILVFGDHNGMDLDNEEMEDFLKEVNPNYNKITSKVNYANVLCGIKVPNIESRKIENFVSKIDVKPTILGLLGIEDEFSLGETIFSTKDYAYISNGDIAVDDFYYYDDTWYYISTGEEVDLNDLGEVLRKKLTDYMQKIITELNISYSIAINNLLK